jgi:hypothetical protein
MFKRYSGKTGNAKGSIAFAVSVLFGTGIVSLPSFAGVCNSLPVNYYCNQIIGATALNNEKLTISGTLADTMGIALGTDPVNPVFVDFSIRLFTRVTGGSPIYTETFTAADTNAVAVSKGHFSLRLGEGTTTYNLRTILTNNPHLFVQIEVRSNTGSFDVLVPRTPLTAAAYLLDAQ